MQDQKAQTPISSDASQPEITPEPKTDKNNIINFIQKNNKVVAIISILLVAIVGIVMLFTSHAEPLYDTNFKPKDDPLHGLVYTYKGKRLRKTTVNHPCKGLFELEPADPATKQPAICTHGPDPVPYNSQQASAFLNKRASNGKPITEDEAPVLLDNMVKSSSPTATTTNSDTSDVGKDHAPFSLPDLKCYDTSSGRRVQLVYVNQSNKPNNYNVYKNLLIYLGRKMDATTLNSKSSVGSYLKRIKFVTDANCVPTVAHISVPNLQIYAPWDYGLNTPGTIYMMFDDGDNSCLAGNIGDDSPALSNKNNSATLRSYPNVGISGWGYCEAHELMHTLGAVNDSAPNSSGGGHCLDGLDVMCYADGSNDLGVNGKPYRTVCHKPGADDAHSGETLDLSSRYSIFIYDCNRNDYFNTSPHPTGYLSNHWDAANNSALQTVGQLGPAIAIASTPSGNGYWIANSQGDVVPYGDADYYGSLLGKNFNGHIVAMATTSSGKGYWLLSNLGAIYSFGDAHNWGSTPIPDAVGLAASGNQGYWILRANGAVYPHGSAPNLGNAVGKIHSAAVAISSAGPSGYTILDQGGGYLTFGLGPTNGAIKTSKASTLALTNNAKGIGGWAATSDGYVGNIGVNTGHGAPAGKISAPIISVAPRPQGDGYWLLGLDGMVYSYAHPYGRY